MKVAILSFGHADSALPMVKALSDIVETELFFVFTPGNRNNNFAHYDSKPEQFGLQTAEHTKGAFPKEVWDYIDDKFTMHSFVFKNLKLKSLVNWKLARKLSKTLRKFDVIHANGKSMFVIMLKFFMPFKNFIYTIHDLENHSGERAKNFLARDFNNRILKLGNQVVLQNKTDFELVKTNYPKRKKHFHFIPFGALEIYKSYKTNGIEAVNSDAIFFGRISQYKGIEYFVDAVKKLKLEKPDIKAVIAGNGNFYFDISEIEKDSAFHIINRYIENDELVALIEKSKMVVCPYVDATQSGVAMTAFVFNKPVIASKTGGFVDVIKEGRNGYLVPVKDSESIYQKMKELLEHPEKLQKMGDYINKQLKTGDIAWSTIAEKYHDAYKQAVS